MSEKNITISDVAEALGVSKTTVSRAISGKGRIGEATRKRVLEYIDKYDYKPNVIEISLYGFDNNSYFEFTHFSNGYTVVDNNIKKLIKNNININFKTVLTKKVKIIFLKLKSMLKN